MTTTIKDLTTAQLVDIHNQLAEKPVKKFRDRQTAEDRVANILAQHDLALGEGGKLSPNSPKQEEAKPMPEQTAAEGVEEIDVKNRQPHEFVREGTNRDKAFRYLEERVGQMVPIDDVLKATYGSTDQKGAFVGVQKGMEVVIEKNGLPYEIKRARENKESTIGLIKQG